MSRATDQWQESMRYALDTGTMPARPRRRLRRFLLLSCLGITSAVAFVKYPGSAPTGGPDADPITPSQTLALANPELVKKRSFTRKSAAEPDKAAAAAQGSTDAASPRAAATEHSPARAARTEGAPKTTQSEAAPQQASRPDAFTPKTTTALAEAVRSPEPTTTGALAERPRRSDDAARTPTVKRRALRDAHAPRAIQYDAAPSEPRKIRRAARKTIALPAIEHMSLPASAPVRPRRPAPQPVVARAPAERVAAVAPRRTKTTVCLYFVVCF
jgi:hypothetical protein